MSSASGPTIFEAPREEQITFIVIYTIPCTIHVIGLHLLLTTRINSISTNQKYYLINLSIIAIIKCLLKIMYRIVYLFHLKDTALQIRLVDAHGTYLCYILIMCLLTIDRFLEIHFNIKYPLLVSARKTKFAIAIAWLVSILFQLVFYLTRHVCDSSCIQRITILYIWPSEEITFLLIAVIIYGYLFSLIRRNRRERKAVIASITVKLPDKRQIAKDIEERTPRIEFKSQHDINNNGRNKDDTGSNRDNITRTDRNIEAEANTERSKARRRSLYLPVLLVGSFIALWLVPDLIDFVYAVMEASPPRVFSIITRLLIATALASDAIVYIFYIGEIRVRFKKNFGGLCKFGTFRVSDS